MWQSNHNLASLIGSRICHDLISPIGAICNGLELMQLDGRPISPEMTLISESVNHANARIRFLRVAFGMAGDQQHMTRSEVASILQDMSAGSRVEFDWTPQAEYSRAQVQEVFLALQCLESSMPQGGVISVTRIGNGSGFWEVSGPADTARPDPRLWEALADPVHQAEIRPAHVQFALLPALVTERGGRIRVESRPGECVLRF